MKHPMYMKFRRSRFLYRSMESTNTESSFVALMFARNEVCESEKEHSKWGLDSDTQMNPSGL